MLMGIKNVDTLQCSVKISVDDILKFSFYFSEKIGTVISCKGDNLHKNISACFL